LLSRRWLSHNCVSCFSLFNPEWLDLSRLPRMERVSRRGTTIRSLQCSAPISYQADDLDEKSLSCMAHPEATKAYVGYVPPIRDSASGNYIGGRTAALESRTRRDFAASPIAVASSWDIGLIMSTERCLDRNNGQGQMSNWSSIDVVRVPEWGAPLRVTARPVFNGRWRSRKSKVSRQGPIADAICI